MKSKITKIAALFIIFTLLTLTSFPPVHYLGDELNMLYDGADFVDRVAELNKKYNKSIVACDVGETEMALYIRSRFDRLGIPAYFSPEDAARGMAALVKYGLYLKKCGQFDQYIELFKKRKNK